MKKILVIVCLALILIMSLSIFVSAGWFSDWRGKITGQVVAQAVSGAEVSDLYYVTTPSYETELLFDTGDNACASVGGTCSGIYRLFTYGWGWNIVSGKSCSDSLSSHDTTYVYAARCGEGAEPTGTCGECVDSIHGWCKDTKEGMNDYCAVTAEYGEYYCVYQNQGTYITDCEAITTGCVPACVDPYICVDGECVQLKENGETCSSDYDCKSGTCGDILANEGDIRDISTNPESVCHENPNKCVVDSTGIEVDYGEKSCLTSKVFRTCYSYTGKIGNSWGAQTPCASDKSCFEGRGCLKQVFLFRLNDIRFPVSKSGLSNPLELEDAMELSDSCVGVSFRINKMPSDESDLDDFVSEMEARGYYYYITAASSDFITFSGYPSYPGQSPFLLNISKICGYLKNKHAEGLYLHELMGVTVGLAGENLEEARRLFDWDSVEEVLACAKANKKKVLWSDFSWMGGWGNIRYAIDHDEKVRKIFETYGDVLVPLIANNVNTAEAWRNDGKSHQNLNGWHTDFEGGLSWGDIKYVSDKYTNGERGASVQDWHWEALTGSLDVPASDIERYIALSYDKGGKYSQFEDSNWDKNERTNHGGFYMGIRRGKNYICGAPPCVSSDCNLDYGFTCESAKCTGLYDKKVKVSWGGNPFDWAANTYYHQACTTLCGQAGNIGYVVEGSSWYQHTCVQNKFIFCFGVRWSKSKTYVHDAYYTSAISSCEGLSESDCNSHSRCSWGSFFCFNKKTGNYF